MSICIIYIFWHAHCDIRWREKVTGLQILKKQEKRAMKKFLATFLMMAVMAVMVPLTVNAQSYTTQRYYRNGKVYTTKVYKKPNFYQRHRNVINMGIGTGAGAILGALIGGKKGAGIGALVGAGGSALYTYKLNPKTKKYYRVYNR